MDDDLMCAAPAGNQGIYKITSPTGRVYIGQALDVAARFARYRGLHCAGQRRLYASFRKHGVENHVFEVIEGVLNETELVERERHWQEFYEVVGPKGLNCKLVTENSHAGRHSAQTRALMAEAARGRRASEDARAKMRAAKLGRKMPEKQRRAMVGRKQPKEQVDKLRRRMAGNSYTKGVVPANARKIINTETGEIFPSVTVAAKALGYKPRTLKSWIDGRAKNKSPLEVYSGQ